MDRFEDGRMPGEEEFGELIKKMYENVTEEELADMKADAASDPDMAAYVAQYYFYYRDDAEEAVVWYRSAAERGQAIAQHMLYVLYDVKKTDSVSEEEALTWLKASADRGNTDACYDLGKYLFNTGGYDGEAFGYFSAAADDPKAKYYLGMCYMFGIGTEKDFSKAFDLFTAAADVARAKYFLGHCYMSGQGTNQDYERAYDIFSELYDNGDTEVAAYIGHCYLELSRTEDNDKVLGLLSEARRRGDTSVLNSLGIFYAQGIGTQKDPRAAFDCFREAAEKNDAPDAQYNLAMCYQNGVGTPADKEEAAEWLRRSAAQGVSQAEDALETLFSDDEDIDEEPEEDGIGTRQTEISVDSNAIIWVHSMRIRQLERELAEARREISKKDKQLERERRENSKKDKQLERERRESSKKDKQHERELAEARREISKKDKQLERERRENSKTINKLVDDLQITGDVVVSNTEKIMASLDVMSGIMSEFRSKFEGMKPEAIPEELLTTAINAAVGRFIGALQDQNIEKVREQLEKRFGAVWHRLAERSRLSLISSWSMWETYRQNDDFDFSGVVICATSALEGELKRLLFDDLFIYAAPKKASEKRGREQDSLLAQLKDDLGIGPASDNGDGGVFKDAGLDEKEQKAFMKRLTKMFNPDTNFCLGRVKYLFENERGKTFMYVFDTDEHIKDIIKNADDAAAAAEEINKRHRVCFDKLREEYLGKTIDPKLSESVQESRYPPYTACFTDLPFNNPPACSIVSKAGKEEKVCTANTLTEKFEYISGKLRNPAAHTGNISKETAEQCVGLIFDPDDPHAERSVLSQVFGLLKKRGT